MRRSEIIADEVEDSKQGERAKNPKSLPDEQTATEKNEDKGGEGASHATPLASQPAQSQNGPYNNPTKPKPSEELKQKKETTPKEVPSGPQLVSSENSDSIVLSLARSPQKQENNQSTYQPQAPVSSRSEPNKPNKIAEDTRSPKTLETSPIKNRATSESAKTDCQSVGISSIV